MSRRVLWHRRAIADLNVADWQTAARIVAEVLHFAESALRGAPYYVRIRYGRATRTILVERVLRWRP